MNQIRYRTETFSGSQIRDAAEVMAYETFELGNTDILEHLSKTLLQSQSIIDRASAFIEELYANDCVEDMGSDEKVAFFREVLSEIEKSTGVSVKYALWLADLDAVTDSDLYGRDMESKEDFDSYEVGPIVLIDLGYDGALYGYTEKPVCLEERIEDLRDELMNIVDERENKSISPERAQWLDERYLEVDAEIQTINDVLLKKHIGDSEKAVIQKPALDSMIDTAKQKSFTQSELPKKERSLMTLSDFLAEFDFGYEVYDNDNKYEDSLRKKLIEDGDLDEHYIHEPLVGLIDKQGANLGHIEGDRFPINAELASNIISRMDIYVNDSVISEFVDAVEEHGYDSSYLSLEDMFLICNRLKVEDVSYSLAEAIISPEKIFIPELDQVRGNTNEHTVNSKDSGFEY